MEILEIRLGYTLADLGLMHLVCFTNGTAVFVNTEELVKTYMPLWKGSCPERVAQHIAQHIAGEE
jgi:hypothetical protein